MRMPSHTNHVASTTLPAKSPPRCATRWSAAVSSTTRGGLSLREWCRLSERGGAEIDLQVPAAVARVAQGGPRGSVVTVNVAERVALVPERACKFYRKSP